MGSRVLIVDDDEMIRRLVAYALQAADFAVEQVSSGPDALEKASEPFDLVLLDISMPDMDGLEVLGRLRSITRVPVILLTARGLEDDRVLGLELGADDYVCKPFSPRELVARVRTVLRRAPAPEPPDLVFDGLVVDTALREVRADGREVRLTPREFDLLAYLAAHPRRVHSRPQLLERVWASSAAWQDEDTVTEHVRRIRRKLGTDPERWIRTVRGGGYVFAG